MWYLSHLVVKALCDGWKIDLSSQKRFLIWKNIFLADLIFHCTNVKVRWGSPKMYHKHNDRLIISTWKTEAAYQ